MIFQTEEKKGFVRKCLHCKNKWARRSLTWVTGGISRNRTPIFALLIFQAVDSISLKPLFFSFFELVQLSEVKPYLFSGITV